MVTQKSCFSETALLYCEEGAGNKGYINLGNVGGYFGGECTSLAGAEVLSVLHLHGEEFRVLARLVLIGKQEVLTRNMATRLCDYPKGGKGMGRKAAYTRA